MTSDVLQFLMSPDAPHFRLSTFGNAGSTHVSCKRLYANAIYSHINTFKVNGYNSLISALFTKENDVCAIVRFFGLLPYFCGYIVDLFCLQTNPKNLDPFYKTDLDLWDFLGRVTLIYSKIS